ncbi:hypothetical protein COCOR_00041 [Corallococcus coralloides DSM 2259]|uniref:Uncharacterized protein n=2 Tax=Corallococcus coralloides TaxID=184914 RepID=H8MTD5_CORCM|nr:hypothetical protein COCOR_00041 [Corallococcus coralloides DSM 2259]
MPGWCCAWAIQSIWIGQAFEKSDNATMISETSKAWIQAGKLLAENPAAQVRCPEKGDGFLTVHDEAISGQPTRFERYLVCDVCGARNVMLMPA